MMNFIIKVYIPVLLFLWGGFFASAVDTATGIFDERFRSLQISVDGAGGLDYPAVISMYGDDAVTVGFDELADDRSFLRYSIVHCNAYWQPSGLADIEVFDSFNFGEVEDYALSRSSYTPYVHYSITLPNERFQFKISGNYLLQVYRDTDPDEILLQIRFMVDESLASITGDILSATDVDYRGAHQQLAVGVDVSNAHVRDQFNDLILSVSQNGRDDNRAFLLHPLRVMSSTLIYEHLPELIFPAGNNYRRFEIVSTTVPNMGVESMEFNDPYWHATLVADRPRNEDAWLYDLNLHGRYVVRERESDESQIDADYVVTHFSLDAPYNPDLDIFIDSDAVCRRLSPESRMVFNHATGMYERTLLLKQGAYSYQYLAKDRKGKCATSYIEGDDYQTRNVYDIAVYHRQPGERYDRLIGVAQLIR